MAQKRRKKKKVGSIALPYLVTIFIGILLVGGGTFLFLRYLGLLGAEKELPEPTPRQITTTTYADNHTILFILDEPENPETSSTFLLMRSIPKEKKLVFVGIPSNTIALVGDTQQSIKTAYEKGGASAAVEFTDYVFGIKTDRYMKLDSAALVKLCDILGGVTYPVSEDIAGFNGDGSDQYLNSSQIEKLITYSFFSGGEEERAYIVSSLVSAMMNQADGKRIADNLDNSFNTMVNLADTNITAVDYKKHKVAIKSMLEYGRTIGSFYIMEGSAAYDDYIASETFLNDFRERFFSYNESDSNEGESDD